MHIPSLLIGFAAGAFFTILLVFILQKALYPTIYKDPADWWREGRQPPEFEE
jgi:hypothetical protein